METNLGRDPMRPTNDLHDILIVLTITGAANALLYLFLAVVARRLGPAAYGLFASLFGIVVFLGVVFTAIQTSVAAGTARSIAGGGNQRYHQARVLKRLAILSVVLTACLVALSPIASRFIHGAGLLAPLAVCLVSGVLLPWSGALGLYQGATRFREYSVFTFLQAFARAATLVVLLWTRDVALLLFAVAISAVLPLGAAVRRLLRHPSSASAPATTVDVEYLPAAIEIEAIPNRAGHALTLLAICTISFPTVGDVILVRHSYSSKEAGLYAGMALVGRCVLFLALAVNAVIYPRLVGARTDSQRRGLRRKSLLLSASLCGAAALLLGAAPHLTLLVFAGAAYSEASALLRAYVLGCLAFAIVATYVYYLLAMTRAKLLLALLVPALAAQVMLPLLINANVRVLVIATMAVALGLLFICVAVTHATDP